MKKALSLLLALVLCLSLCACSYSDDTPETTKAPTTEATEVPTTEATEVPTTEATEVPTTEAVEVPTTEATEPIPVSYWTTEYMVDDFGNPTDKMIIKSVVSGLFSNTANSDAELLVVVYLITDTNEKTFGFKLLEYGKQPATFTDEDEMILTTKVGEKISEHKIVGSSNGTVFTAGYAGWDFINILAYNDDIHCAIEINGAKYTFTIEREGFYEELKPLISK